MSLPSRSSALKTHGIATQGGPASRILGDGEMAELIRGFDWESTPLGPVETWPDTLITTVNLLLASRHPMFLWWGPELIQFYNDGYRPSIREDKHPGAVGQRGLDCWPEIWHIVGPQIEAVMSRGESSWNTNQLVPINRNGKLEEVFWTYSYSPVRDKDGAVQGTLVVCSETTEQVLAERRLRQLLAINAGSSARYTSPEPETLVTFAQAIFRRLDADPADFPFAALYLLSGGGILPVAASASMDDLALPERWPLASVAKSQTPLLVGDLQQRFGDLVFKPWPEPVTRAYLLPLAMPGLSIQGVLLLGISPRLPFDSNYQTFFQLVGNRIAALLQGEIHQLDLARAAERFSRLAEANPFGMVIGRLGGELEYANPAFLNTFGYSEDDVNAGKIRWDALTPAEYAKADGYAVQQLRATGRCDVYEKEYLAKDGRRVPILLGASTIDSAGDDSEIAAFITDLTPLKTAEEALRKANDELEKKVKERTAALETEVQDRKRAEIGLRDLTGRLLLIQDEERRRMARDLHDHAGQTLTALGLNLSALLEATSQNPETNRQVAESLQLSDDLSRELRTLSYLLHPPLLDEAGLASALRWYVRGFSERSNIKVALALPEDLPRFPNEIELVIFRVVQECLTNIHRHSGSPSAQISLICSDDAAALEVTDVGRGIPQERQREMTTARAGVGMRGMEERVRQFAGTLQIASSPGGTKVTVVLPLKPNASG